MNKLIIKKLLKNRNIYQNKIQLYFSSQNGQKLEEKKLGDIEIPIEQKEQFEKISSQQNVVQDDSSHNQNQNTKKGIWASIKHGIHEAWVGTKKTYQDYKFTKQLIRNKQIYTENYTAQELLRLRRIKKDAFKLVPFSLFLLVPFLELCIPIYILIFPNAFPTNYIPQELNQQRMQLKLQKQEQAHKQLVISLKSFLLNEGIKLEDIAIQSKLRDKVVQFQKQIDLGHNIKNMHSDLLIQVCEYLIMDYITGTHLINTIYKNVVNLPKYIINAFFFIIRSKKRVQFNHWIFNKQLKLNFGPFEIIKRKLLIYQIQAQIKQLRQEDHALTKFGFEKQLVGLKEMAQNRGIQETKDLEIKEFFNEYWLPKTDNLTLSNNLYFWFAVLNHKSDIKAYETF